MRRTLAVIALLGFSGVASAAPADDSETERTTLLRIISEGTAAIAAAAACDVDRNRIDRATATQSNLIRASAVRMGYADPEILIKIRDEGFVRGLNDRAHLPIATRPLRGSKACSTRARANYIPVGPPGGFFKARFLGRLAGFVFATRPLGG